jgi:hypothetical protein
MGARDHFWPKRPTGWLRDGGNGVSGDEQQLAFDMVVRAAQYTSQSNSAFICVICGSFAAIGR